MTTTTFPKIDTRESFFKLFFKGKVGTVKIKLLFIWHPVSATTTFPLNLSVEWRRYHVFPPKWRWSTRALYLAFVCLFACISDGPSMRAWQVSKGKRKWGKAMMRIRAKHFLVPSRSWHAGYDGPEGAAPWNGLLGGRSVTERYRFSGWRYIKEMLFRVLNFFFQNFSRRRT